MELGADQFDYPVAAGLQPDHHLLEIGCGNLRAGWRFIDYLDVGHYTGVDISPDVLFAAQATLIDFNAAKGGEHQVLREDYYYRPGDLTDLARRHGFTAEVRADWTANAQAKMRLRVATASTS